MAGAFAKTLRFKRAGCVQATREMRGGSEVVGAELRELSRGWSMLIRQGVV